MRTRRLDWEDEQATAPVASSAKATPISAMRVVARR